MSDKITQTTTETASGIFVDLADPKEEDIIIADIAWSLSRQGRFGGHSISKIPYTVAQHTVMVSRYIEWALTPGTDYQLLLLEYLTDRANKAKDNQEMDYWLDIRERARECPEDHRQMVSFHGLMHDFAEAYLIDLPTPVKRLPGVYDAYKSFELMFDALIYRKFKLGYGPRGSMSLGDIERPEFWDFALAIVGWADMFALRIESYFLTSSRGRNWGTPLPPPNLNVVYDFKWPIHYNDANDELLARFEELRPKGEHE